MKISIIEWITYDNKWKTLWQKEKLHVLCNFFFCHYVFKKSVCCRGLASNDCNFVNGQAIAIDGGMSAGGSERLYEKLIS